MQSDAKPNQDPGEKKSRFWQFSLRETVLAMTAIAAIIAVLISNRPRQTSAMAQQFDPIAIVSEILIDETLKGSVFLSTSGFSISQSELSKDFEISITHVSAADAKTKVMLALRERIGELIEQNGYEISARSVAGSGRNGNEWTAISRFSYRYKGARIRGHLRVLTSFENEGNGSPKLIVILDEY